MKILVTVKRVEDPEIKIKVKPDGSGIVTDQMKYVVNPFDEIAVEEALRIKEQQGGEVVVACIGVADATHQIRTALAMGADRGLHVVYDQPLDSYNAAALLAKLVEAEKPDLVLMGKQGVDLDAAQASSFLAHRLGWAAATFAAKHESLESDNEKKKVPGIGIKDKQAEVVREVDGGLERVSVTLPCIVTCDLRLNQPRYASLPGIMKAKRKQIDQKTPADLGVTIANRVTVTKLEAPPERKAGERVADVPTLVSKLINDAKVL